MDIPDERVFRVFIKDWEEHEGNQINEKVTYDSEYVINENGRLSRFWMPREYNIMPQDLRLFKMEIGSGENSTTAFKDIESK